jgi:hypothetical protein
LKCYKSQLMTVVRFFSIRFLPSHSLSFLTLDILEIEFPQSLTICTIPGHVLWSSQ